MPEAVAVTSAKIRADIRQVDAVALACRLVAIPSLTPVNEVGRNGSRDCLDLVAAIMQPHGFSYRILTFDHESHEGNYPVDNLLCVRKSSQEGAPHLCFIGHVDTVSIGDEAHWTFSPFGGDVADGLLRGRGSRDMKGAVAAFCAAAHNLPDNLNVSILLTAHEEVATKAGIKASLDWMNSQGERPDYFIVGEPSSTHAFGDEIATGCAGRVYATLGSNGVQGHVANEESFLNPYTVLIHVLHELQEKKWDDGGNLYPDTRIEIIDFPGVKDSERCVIPGSAQCQIGVVHSPHTSPETVYRWIEDTIKQHGQGQICILDSDHLDYYHAPPGALAHAMQGAITDSIDVSSRFALASFSSDGRFITRVFPDAEVIEFGPRKKGPEHMHERGCGGMHQVDEALEIKDIERMEQVYGAVMRRLAEAPVPTR